MPQASIRVVEGSPTQRIYLHAENFEFAAGQYLEVVHPNGTRVPLSIASSPARLPELELHYRSTPGNAEATAMDELIGQSTIEISEPAGTVRCPAPGQPLTIIAGGTGAAQAFAMSEAHPASRVVWCADQIEDTYELERMRRQTASLEVLIDARRSDENEAIVWLQTHARDFRDSAVVLAGSPAFVYRVTDLLIEDGFSLGQLQSDVYAYAPR